MIDLPQITLCCINCVDPSSGVKALKYSSKEISFGRIILFSHICPEDIPNYIEFIQIPHLTHDTSSQFALQELPKYINTDYCLSIHDDGFIINPHLWTEEFLTYDYIGAPWAHTYPGGVRVGNGGFVLKSKKLMKLSADLSWVSGVHDDGLICITNRQFFINNGCTFAPLEVAMKFSLESKIPECDYNLDNCFGFHGRGEVYDVFQGEGQQFKDKIKLLESV